MFADALKIAKSLDAHFDATNELVGPLHGVPVSFKDLSEFGYTLNPGHPVEPSLQFTFLDTIHRSALRDGRTNPLRLTQMYRSLKHEICGVLIHFLARPPRS